MATTWPDTTVESPDGARTTFTLTSGLSPINPLVMVGGATGELNVSPTQFSFNGAILTLTFAPALGEIVNVYFLSTGAVVGSPGLVSLSSLRLQVRQRADMVNSQFVTDSELTSYINSAYTELYDLLVQKFGDDYFVSDPPYTFTTDGINELYVLPAALFKLKGVEVKNGSVWCDVPRMNFGERNKGGADPRSNLRYRLLGGKLLIRSGGTIPSAGLNMRLWHVPRVTLLVNDSDLVDGVDGWEEYIIVDAAIACLAKEESDTSQLERERAALTQRIESAAENRDESGPQVVTDVRSESRGYWPTWENP